MAFLDLVVGSPVPLSRTAETRLGAHERKVVLLARTDPPSSLRRSPVTRMARLLFGIEAPHRLADARLEALRRYAILYRVGGEVDAETEQARAAGFSDAELRHTRALIDVAFGAQPPRHGPVYFMAAALGLVVAALLAFGAARAIAKAIDSPLVATTLVALAFVSIVSLVGPKSPAGGTTSR